MILRVVGCIDADEGWTDPEYLREHLEYLFKEYLQDEGIRFRIEEWTVIKDDNRHEGK
jgi:hypothetical protein|tara:strand:- start:346 stop:519 length:174 start_codon:yes stop_codon:yes gene_type:complete